MFKIKSRYMYLPPDWEYDGIRDFVCQDYMFFKRKRDPDLWSVETVTRHTYHYMYVTSSPVPFCNQIINYRYCILGSKLHLTVYI